MKMCIVSIRAVKDEDIEVLEMASFVLCAGDDPSGNLKMVKLRIITAHLQTTG